MSLGEKQNLKSLANIDTASILRDYSEQFKMTEIAAIQLDRDFKIVSFTQTATRLFPEIQNAIGHVITELDGVLTDSELEHDLRAMIRDKSLKAQQIATLGGSLWLRQLDSTYGAREQADGAVLTFCELTPFIQNYLTMKQASANQLLKLKEREEYLSAIMNTAIDSIITIDSQGSILSVNPSTERMFGYNTDEMIGQNVKMLMPSPHREKHDTYLENYQRTRQARIIGIGREVEARRKDGTVFPVDLAVSEVDHSKVYTGFLRDLSQRKQMERDMAEIAMLEQQRIGQDLHDDCGQQLTALGLLAETLGESLPDEAVAATNLVEKLKTGLKAMLRQIRSISRGLAFVEQDFTSLVSALKEMVLRLSETTNVTFHFQEVGKFPNEDKFRALQLYHIAQESCTNALKHAEASHVQISLRSEEHGIILEIEDDGNGFQIGSNNGLGIRVMQNRAGIIGGCLTIEPAQPQGTLVRCTIHELKHGE